MKVILTPNMAKELLENEEMIKKQEGPYRPQYRASVIPVPGTTLIKREYVPVIKNWPLEEYKGGEIQQREVIPGMEAEVDDICMAKIDEGTISYKINKWRWYPSFNPFTKVADPPQKLLEYSIIIYTPTFENDTIFLTAGTLNELYEMMKENHIVNEKEDQERTNGRKSMAAHFESIDKWFDKYQGICTYILLKGENVVKCGKFENKKYW